MATDLIALSERVAALKEPCRETDALVAEAIGLAQFRDGDLYYMHPEAGSTTMRYTPRFYTSSLDAAMALVPKYANVTLQTFGAPGPMALVEPNERFVAAVSPALAVTAAALRSRAQQF